MPRLEETAQAHPDGMVVSRIVEVDDVPMSAIVRQVPRPRAVIVALHGGAASAHYFHHPGPPHLSLLETGAALGFTVLALDRPGYGRSAPLAEGMRTADRRVELAYGAVDRLLESGSSGAGVFVVAHSAGCELAVRMAADPRRGDLLGLELAGTGRELHPTARRILEGSRQDTSLPRQPTGLQDLLWEPAALYPAEVIGGAHFASRAPRYEADVLAQWIPHDFARTAAEIRVPVQYTLGDHDMVWCNDPVAMADIAALFINVPRVVTNVQVSGGHNLSLGLTATAYHLKVLSFVEECLVASDKHTASEVN